MIDNNPRKTLRINVRFLEHQRALLKRRMETFGGEIERLKNIEKNSSDDIIRITNQYWKRYNWYAFPER